MRFLESNWVKLVAVASSELQDSMFENINERNLSPSKCSGMKYVYVYYLQ